MKAPLSRHRGELLHSPGSVIEPDSALARLKLLVLASVLLSRGSIAVTKAGLSITKVHSVALPMRQGRWTWTWSPVPSEAAVPRYPRVCDNTATKCEGVRGVNKHVSVDETDIAVQGS